MVTATAKAVMPIITVDAVDDIYRFYTDKLGFSRVMGCHSLVRVPADLERLRERLPVHGKLDRVPARA